MKRQKGFIALVLIVLITLAAIIGLVYLYYVKSEIVAVNTAGTPVGNQEAHNQGAVSTSGTDGAQAGLMSLDVYIQNKEVAKTSDCRVTQKVTYKVPRTSGVADASLKILFKEELARYGIYKSVRISNGVAMVSLQSELTPTGNPLGSLSSCEVGHLLSVLNDTLTQYESVQSVEIYSPAGKIEF